MTPKTFVETKLCTSCYGEGEVDLGGCGDPDCCVDSGPEICYTCDGSGYVEETITSDPGLPEANPSA